MLRTILQDWDIPHGDGGATSGRGSPARESGSGVAARVRLGRSPADDPFGHGDVDHPAGAHQQRPAELARRADDQDPRQVGQHLRARAQPIA